MVMDYSIKIGGEAGQGIQTIGDALGRVFIRSGYYFFPTRIMNHASVVGTIFTRYEF